MIRIFIRGGHASSFFCIIVVNTGIKSIRAFLAVHWTDPDGIDKIRATTATTDSDSVEGSHIAPIKRVQLLSIAVVLEKGNCMLRVLVQYFTNLLPLVIGAEEQSLIGISHALAQLLRPGPVSVD